MLRAALDEQARPLLSPHAVTLADEDGIMVVADDTAYSFRSTNAELMRTVLPHLDGSLTVGDLAGLAGVSWEEISASLTPLAMDNWLVDETAVHRARQTQEFFDAYRALCEFWKKDIFTHAFWQILASGKASRELVLGWLVEFYHYVDAANEHMPVSAANCRDDDTIQLWLAQHYTEEYDHNQIFLDGLVKTGLEENQVRSSPPLASTRAVINYITEVASSDTIGYAAMHGIFQTPGSSESWAKIERFYEFLLTNYEFGAPVLKAFRDHAALDAELGHDDLVFSRICARVGRFSEERVDRILRCTRGLVEQFILYFDGILDYYGSPDASLPRPRLDVRGLL